MAPACQLCGSVGRGFTKGKMASACLSVLEKVSASSCLNARYFSSSLYATGAFQAATPVPFKLRGSESMSMCGFFKRKCLVQWFLPLTQSPLLFNARSYRNLSSWPWNPKLGGLVWGWDSLVLTYPSQSFIHHTWI